MTSGCSRGGDDGFAGNKFKWEGGGGVDFSCLSRFANQGYVGFCGIGPRQRNGLDLV